MATEKARFIEIHTPDNKKYLLCTDQIIQVEQNPEGVNTLITLRSLEKRMDRRGYLQFKEFLNKSCDVYD